LRRIADPRIDPEMSMRVAQLNERFETALSRLPAEDAAIVRLKYVEGLTNAAIERAIGASEVTTSRLQDILGRLRSALVGLGVEARDIALVRGQP
jgi:RNA polymerase sigma factor (sigma-70 family)